MTFRSFFNARRGLRGFIEKHQEKLVKLYLGSGRDAGGYLRLWVLRFGVFCGVECETGSMRRDHAEAAVGGGLELRERAEGRRSSRTLILYESTRI